MRIDAHAHVVEELVVVRERSVLLDRHGLRHLGGLALPQLFRRAGRGGVRDHRMHGVVQVLHEHLPVAVVEIAQTAAVISSRPRASGRRGCRSMKASRRSTRGTWAIGEAGENKAAVDLVRHRRESGLAQPGPVVALLERNVEERAVQAVSPRVVRAAQRLARVPGEVVDELRALVGAAVHQHAHAAVGLAHENQGLGGDIDGDEVARLRTWLVWPT